MQAFLIKGGEGLAEYLSCYPFFRRCKLKYYMLNANGNSFTRPSLKCLQINRKVKPQFIPECQ